MITDDLFVLVVVRFQGQMGVTDTLIYMTLNACSMFTAVIGIDTNIERAEAQARTIAEIPVADETVKAILVHDFDENPEAGTVEQVKSVRQARDILEEAGIEVELEGASGDASEAIIRAADSHDADRIVLAGRKRSPVGKALLGSVTQDVILNTDRPVLVCSAREAAE